MAKRFTDTEKWKKPFLRGMKAPYKLLWLYILDECNHAGIWHVDFEVAQIKIGEKLNVEKAKEFFKGKILAFDNSEKWFVYDFIDFQYGTLNPLNRAHSSVINILEKYSIDWQNKPLTSPLQGAMDMDKEKDMVKDMVKEGVQGENWKCVFPFDSENFKLLWSEWKTYLKTHRKQYQTFSSEQAGLEFVSKMSEAEATETIKTCMRNNWKNLRKIDYGNTEITNTGGKAVGSFNGNKAETLKLATLADDFLTNVERKQHGSGG